MSKKEAPKRNNNQKETSVKQLKREEENKKEKLNEKESIDEVKKEEEELLKKIEFTRRAGELTKRIKESIRPKLKVGVKIIDIIKDIEKMILDLEVKPAFPINVCINNIAAHYTSPVKDETIINQGDIVKIDFGVQIEGYCVDNAFSVSFNEDEALKNIIEAPEVAVKAAIMMMKPGVKTQEVARKIHSIVKGYGYNVLKELGGHQIKQWSLHAGKEIPNLAISATHGGDTIEENEVYAVEVFASNGEGTVHQSGNVHIYSLNPSVGRVPLRRKISGKILGLISKKYKTLPFCERQLVDELKAGISFGLQELINSGKITQHPVLLEKKGVYISQYEETVLITKDGCEQLT